MTLYGTALFLHIVFAIILVGGTAWEHVAASLVKRARTVEAARAHVDFLSTLNKAMMPTAMLTLIPALYLAFAGDWWGAGWPVVALVLFSSAGALAGSIVDPAMKRMQTTITDAADGPMTPELGRALFDPKLSFTTWVLAGIDVAIIALMTNKPGYLGSVVIGLIGLTVGAAVGIRENRHAAAPAAPPAAGATA